MIEMITGGPGAGKTTFAVATRLVTESKATVKLDDESCIKLGMELGTVIPRRLVCAGVRGLKLEHERLPHILTRDAVPDKEVQKWNAMEPGNDKQPVYQRLPGEPPMEGVPCLVENWWLWAMPGDLICIDEAQYLMPRGSLGRIPPYWLWVMSTHRHYGVDFLIITQASEMIETHVKKLVTLHRHVRPVLGTPFCMVYVWDHASNTERIQTASKTRFFRWPSYYKLFNSAVAHVKPQTQSRAVLVLVPALLAVVGAGFWHFKKRFSDPVPLAAAAAQTPAPGLPPRPGALGAPGGVPARPWGYVDVPDLAGCFTVGQACKCMSRSGQWVQLDAAMCRASAGSFDGLVKWAPRLVPPPPSVPASGPVARLPGV